MQAKCAWVGLLLLVLAGTAPAVAGPQFEWNAGMRHFFQSAAAQEIVLDVTNPDDHRWIAYQMMGLRFLAPQREAVERYQGSCVTLFGQGAWLAGLPLARAAEVGDSDGALCVPAPASLAEDVAWQRKVCARAFHKRWNGRVSGTQFSCRGQIPPAEIDRMTREAAPAPGPRPRGPGE